LLFDNLESDHGKSPRAEQIALKIVQGWSSLIQVNCEERFAADACATTLDHLAKVGRPATSTKSSPPQARLSGCLGIVRAIAMRGLDPEATVGRIPKDDVMHSARESGR
jgi:hypothetical protein